MLPPHTYRLYVFAIVDSVSRTQSVIPYAGSLKRLHHCLPQLDLCHRAVYVYSARARSVPSTFASDSPIVPENAQTDENSTML